MNNQKIIAEWEGGSRLYGISTPESDVDVRKLVINTNPEYILGSKRFDQETRQNKKEDYVAYEVRSLLTDYVAGRTHAFEVLWLDENVATIHDNETFQFIRKYRKELANGHNLFRSLSGFMQGERIRATTLAKEDKPENKKRNDLIRQYGFVPKSFANYIRLAYSGVNYFIGEEYKVEHNESVTELLISIRTNPQGYVDKFESMFNNKDEMLKMSYEIAKEEGKIREGDEKLLNWLLLRLYFPIILESYELS